jgi:hypothetical protein
MRINFSAWAIRNPVPPILLFAVLCLLGIISFMRLPVTKFPNIDVPVVLVQVTQSGATPAELETQVTREVEDAIANITGVKHMTSTFSDGASTRRSIANDTDRAVLDAGRHRQNPPTCRARSTSRWYRGLTSGNRSCRLRPQVPADAEQLSHRRCRRGSCCGRRRPGRAAGGVKRESACRSRSPARLR